MPNTSKFGIEIDIIHYEKVGVLLKLVHWKHVKIHKNLLKN